MQKIILLGCGGHAKSIVDMIQSQGIYEVVGFVDRQLDDSFEYRGIKIIGTDSDLYQIYSQGIQNACVSIGFMGNGNLREQKYQYLKSIGFHLPVIIDSSATIARDAVIEEGTVIGKNCIINSEAIVGKMVIVNSAAVIEHECKVEDFSHIAVGAVLCGMSHIGKQCMIGANSVIVQNILIGSNTIVGAGAVVTNDLPGGCTAVGTPAKIIKQV